MSNLCLILLILQCLIVIDCKKYGKCPDLTAQQTGNCITMCNSHNDCPEQSLCCPYTCGYVCSVPAAEPRSLDSAQNDTILGAGTANKTLAPVGGASPQTSTATSIGRRASGTACILCLHFLIAKLMKFSY